MAPKPPLAVKIEVLLNDKDKKFYPGDTVMGKIFITSNQNYSLKNLRLAWTGRIQVQPLKDNKEVQKYFNECWKLGPKITKAPSKTPYGSSQISFYKGELISVTDQDPEPKVELSKNKPFAFAFEVHVPNDRPLPSSTIENTNYKIIYLLEAFIAQPETNEEEKPAFFGQRTVPVLEPIYTRTEEMMRPQRAEQVFTVVPSNDAVDYKSAVRVTLPCRGCQTGVAIPISISIWNNVEFSRKQGISISLFRVNQIVANGRAYTSAGEKVHRIVADLDITPDAKENNQLVQTVRVALPIPKGTTPTITLEKSGLLSIAYYIRVQVYAQEGQYITPDGAMSKFMLVDIPFVVGTLATPLESPKSTSTTPISSPKSSFNGVIFTEVYTENSSRVTSPTNANFTDSRYSFSSSSSPPPYPATLTSSFGIVPTSSTSATSNGRTTNQGSTPITSPVLTNYKNNENDSVTSGGSTNSDGGTTTTSAATTLIDNKKGGRMMGGMFRKSSSGSNVSVENKKTKKKNVFSSFKLYSRSNSNASTKVVTEEEEEKANSMPDKNYAEERKEDQQKEENNVQIEDQATLPVSNEGGGVFEIFSRDDDSFDESKDQQEKSPAGEVEKVFKMFPDDDSDDEEPEEPETQPQSGGGGGGVFQLFPDDDSDDDDDNAEDRTVSSAAPPLHSDNSENLDSTAANIEAPLTYEVDSMTNQRLLSSHVHQMFNDSTDDENEESDVQGLSISEPIESSNTEEQKPNAKEEEVFHKPDTNDETQPSMHEEHDGSDMSSDEDEYDILGALARKERLQRKIA